MSGRLATLAAAGLAAIALGGCGSSEQGLLPPAEAQELLASLAAIETLADERKCLDAAAASQALVGRVGELGNEVDEELRRALVNGAERLVTLARDPEACTGERSEEPRPPAEEDRQEEDTGGERAPADEDDDEQAPQGDQPQDGEPTDEDGGQPPKTDGDQDGGSTDQPPTDSTPQLPGPPSGSGGTTPEGGTAP